MTSDPQKFTVDGVRFFQQYLNKIRPDAMEVDNLIINSDIIKEDLIVHVSKMIDRLALYDLHRKRSIDKHFSAAFTVDINDREEFYSANIADVSIDLNESSGV